MNCKRSKHFFDDAEILNVWIHGIHSISNNNLTFYIEVNLWVNLWLTLLAENLWFYKKSFCYLPMYSFFIIGLTTLRLSSIIVIKLKIQRLIKASKEYNWPFSLWPSWLQNKATFHQRFLRLNSRQPNKSAPSSFF